MTKQDANLGPASITGILAAVVVQTPVKEAPVAVPVVYNADPKSAAETSDKLGLLNGM